MIFDVDEFGTKVMAGFRSGNIAIFDLNQGKCAKVFGGHFDSVGCVQFSPIANEIALSASGQRHYKVPGTVEGLEEMSDDEAASEQRNGIRVWHIPY